MPLLSSLDKDQLRESDLSAWTKVHDRIANNEMPPESPLNAMQRSFLSPLAERITELDQSIIARYGRTRWRRLNRFEYENAVRELLDAPWLQLANILPEDGEKYGFNKVGEALDVSHVNMARYMQAANYALHEVVMAERHKPPVQVTRYYARDQGSFNRRVHYNPFNRSPERATFPLIDYTADLEVLRNPDHPFSVGDTNPEMREREAFGVVASSYEPIEVQFSEFKAKSAGRYRLRFKGYTFWAAGEEKRWWRPDREATSCGRRSEPVTIYSRLPPRQLRRLGDFDFHEEPSVQVLDVWLQAGETIQPDAVRLFRSRPSNWHNPLAEKDGMPGVAFQWMEVEGPIYETWPPAGHALLLGASTGSHTDFGDANHSSTSVRNAEVKHRIAHFATRALRATEAELGDQIELYSSVVMKAIDQGLTYRDALFSGYTAILCSPEFLCTSENLGALEPEDVAARLSLFLWNAPPDAEFVARARREGLRFVKPAELNRTVDEMLRDARSQRFIDSFLAYWLDLRKINDTSPDELLYPDYYLDDSLVDAAQSETQLFFQELLDQNMPISTIVDSDFTFANERLAKHYGLPHFEGAALRKVALPDDSVRGGFLTQASVLKVTANGTTTSPVVRGAWVNQRILGVDIPPPPAAVPAIEPDTRGATTIREQLALHRADETCNQCHKVIDPVGFALESFDVAGGFREHYRAIALPDPAEATGQTDASSHGESPKPVEGYGKNGQPFQFHLGPPVDSSGVLPSGEPFADVRELKRVLVSQNRQLARNFVEKLIIYATGAPPRFSERGEIEAILNRQEPDGFPVRALVQEVVASSMFLTK